MLATGSSAAEHSNKLAKLLELEKTAMSTRGIGGEVVGTIGMSRCVRRHHFKT